MNEAFVKVLILQSLHQTRASSLTHLLTTVPSSLQVPLSTTRWRSMLLQPPMHSRAWWMGKEECWWSEEVMKWQKRKVWTEKNEVKRLSQTCLKSSWAEGESEANGWSPWRVSVLLPSITTDRSTRLTSPLSPTSCLEEAKPLLSVNVT